MLLTNHQKRLPTLLFQTATWLMAVLGALTLLYSAFWFSWLTMVQALVCCVGATFLFFYWRVLQRDLHARNEELQRLLQTMNEGFLISDENEAFLYVNDTLVSGKK